jgi:hypothetical protein
MYLLPLAVFWFFTEKAFVCVFLETAFRVMSPCVAGVPQQSRFPPQTHTHDLTTSQPHFPSKLVPPAPSSSKFIARVMPCLHFMRLAQSGGVAADGGGCRPMRAALLPCRRSEEPVGILFRTRTSWPCVWSALSAPSMRMVSHSSGRVKH